MHLSANTLFMDLQVKFQPNYNPKQCGLNIEAPISSLSEVVKELGNIFKGVSVREHAIDAPAMPKYFVEEGG